MSHGTPERLAAAMAAGAVGIQVGTAFALAEDSGLAPSLRDELRAGAAEDSLAVRTDLHASPTGFPFKVAGLAGTLAEARVYDDRQRLCDLGYLRTPYQTEGGHIGYRCPSEPNHMYLRKGGDHADTLRRA